MYWQTESWESQRLAAFFRPFSRFYLSYLPVGHRPGLLLWGVRVNLHVGRERLVQRVLKVLGHGTPRLVWGGWVAKRKEASRQRRMKDSGKTTPARRSPCCSRKSGSSSASWSPWATPYAGYMPYGASLPTFLESCGARLRRDETRRAVKGLWPRITDHCPPPAFCVAFCNRAPTRSTMAPIYVPPKLELFLDSQNWEPPEFSKWKHRRSSERARLQGEGERLL